MSLSPELKQLKLPRSRRGFWLILLTGLASVAAALGWLEPSSSKVTAVLPGTYYVSQVYDGDTIEVTSLGERQKVRLIGIDTPELHDPRKPVQCFAQAASEKAHDLAMGQHVRLVSDPLSANYDKYDRLLRYVYLNDGRLLNRELVAQGYAFAYTLFPFTKMEEFRAAQRTAREAELGLWSACPVTKTDAKFETSPVE